MKWTVLATFFAFSLILLVMGCGETDTGDRRVDMKMWYYNPPQASNELPGDMETEILVFADEHWHGAYGDSYNPIDNAKVYFNDNRVPYVASRRGYHEYNQQFAPNDEFELKVVLDGRDNHIFSDVIPDIVIGGLPDNRDTTMTTSDTLNIGWTQFGDQDGHLSIIYGDETIETLSGRHRSEERRVGKECRSRWSP